MNKKNLMIIFIMTVLIAGCGNKPIENELSPTNQDQIQTQTTAPFPISYIKCDADGKINISEISSATYYAKDNFTLLFTSKEYGKGILDPQSTSVVIFVGKSTGTFDNKGKESWNPNISINHLEGGTGGSQSYETYDKDSNAQATITVYSGNIIEGTAMGTLFFVDLKGIDKTRKINLKCSFHSELPIEQK